MNKNHYRRGIYLWLCLGLGMIWVQIIIGGVTRLTDSGLSITEWAIIQGTLPPLSQDAWEEAFQMYRTAAAQQYETLHADMTLSEFKWIYFWEYLHRVWARLMGFVFILPLGYFLIRGWVDRALGGRLLIVFLLAAAAAVFGWIMVASGLNNDTRTWVSAYKLIVHLGIATSLFGFLYYTIRWYRARTSGGLQRPGSMPIWVLIIFFIQILIGGLMAGMRAGLLFPFYPLVLKAGLVSQSLSQSVDAASIIDYEPSVAIKAWVQLLHRFLALLILLAGVYATWRYPAQKALRWFVLGICIQYLLGVMTIVKSVGSIPIAWGAIHQAMALIVLALLIRWMYPIHSIRKYEMKKKLTPKQKVEIQENAKKLKLNKLNFKYGIGFLVAGLVFLAIFG